MTKSQKLAMRMSECRQRLNELTGLEELTDEQRSEMAALSVEYQKLEPEYRAALVVEDTDGGDGEERSEDGEGAEYRALVERSRLGVYLSEAITGRQVDGAEAELRSAVFGDAARDGLVPWEMLLPRQVDEERQDVATSYASDVGRNQQSIVARVFARTAAAFVGVDMPSVPIGDVSYPIFEDGDTADLQAKGGEHDAVAAMISAKTLDPVRLTARYLFNTVDAMRLSGLEEALRGDLRGTMGTELDKAILVGDGTAPAWSGFFDDAASTGITNAANATAEVDYDRAAVLASLGIDGKHAASAMDVRLLFNVEGLQKLHSLFKTNGHYSAADYLRENSGGLMASDHAPAKNAKRVKLLLYRMGAGGMNAVAPVWQGLEVIRDPYSQAAKGQVAITAVAFHSFGILRPGAFLVENIQVDA